jgi:hypothetical protein
MYNTPLCSALGFHKYDTSVSTTVSSISYKGGEEMKARRGYKNKINKRSEE